MKKLTEDFIEIKLKFQGFFVNLGNVSLLLRQYFMSYGLNGHQMGFWATTKLPKIEIVVWSIGSQNVNISIGFLFSLSNKTKKGSDETMKQRIESHFSNVFVLKNGITFLHNDVFE